MKRSAVAPELRGALRRVPPLPFGSRLGRYCIRTLLRLMPSAKLDGVKLDIIDTATIPLRTYHPQVRRCNAALFWIHGGGFMIGQASMDDRFCATTARELGIVVISVDYRLAPEQPFPTPLDDCHAGWEWLQRSAPELGIDPRKIAVGGQSAGGGLAATLVQRIHDTAANRAAAQWLFCPMLDDRTAARRELDTVNHPVWNNRRNALGWRLFLAQEPGLPDVPPYAVAARREDLRGLPPAWIGVGDADLFCDEDRVYADRLRAAGVDVSLNTVNGAPHGFEAWAPEARIAREYVTAAHTWLAQILCSTKLDSISPN